MPIPDKIAAANKINELLRGVVANAGLRLKYRITVDPPVGEDRDWERPEILVEFAGPDSPLMLERGAELLRSIELIALEMLRLPGNEHEKISFDCMEVRDPKGSVQVPGRLSPPIRWREHRLVEMGLDCTRQNDKKENCKEQQKGCKRDSNESRD